MPQTLPNLHHLELFYHVAKAGGITAAVRSMPYGIQQPAVSGQITQLENELGVRLFQRRPFQLTPAGQELYDFVAPFFGGLATVAERVAGKASKHLRLAAPTTVIQKHLPEVLHALRRACPDLELTLMDTDQQAVFELLEKEAVDLAVAELEGKPPSGTRSELLLKMPLVLLLPPGVKVPKGGIKSLAGKHPLIRPSDSAPMAKAFNKGLTKKGITWPAQIEVNTLEGITHYVGHNFGIGLAVMPPDTKLPKGVTAMELNGFPEMKIVGMWRGKLGPLAEKVLADLKRRASSK